MPGATPPCVLYDDCCGFCRRWVRFWGPALVRHGFSVAPLQCPWVAKAIPLPTDELLGDVRLLLPTGEHLRGAEVYRHVMRRIWWAWPFYVLSVTPGFSLLFDLAYRAFARHRHRFSRACGLSGGGR